MVHIAGVNVDPALSVCECEQPLGRFAPIEQLSYHLARVRIYNVLQLQPSTRFLSRQSDDRSPRHRTANRLFVEPSAAVVATRQQTRQRACTTAPAGPRRAVATLRRPGEP